MVHGFALKGCAVGSAAVFWILRFPNCLNAKANSSNLDFEGSSRSRDKSSHAHVHVNRQIGF